jgi:hypothetical protein
MHELDLPTPKRRTPRTRPLRRDCWSEAACAAPGCRRGRSTNRTNRFPRHACGAGMNRQLCLQTGRLFARDRTRRG